MSIMPLIRNLERSVVMLHDTAAERPLLQRVQVIRRVRLVQVDLHEGGIEITFDDDSVCNINISEHHIAAMIYTDIMSTNVDAPLWIKQADGWYRSVAGGPAHKM